MPNNLVVKNVNPAEAKRYLRLNNSNRKVNESTVRNYAKMMAEGRWHKDADTPIKVANDNKLLDGQHRLLAIIESGTTQEMTFRLHCDPAAQQHMDRGRKRSLADDLQIHGYKYNTLLSSTLNLIYPYLVDGTVSHKTATIDFDTASQLLDEFIEIPDWAAHITARVDAARKLNGDTSMTRSEALFVYFLTKHTTYSDLADEFLEGMLFGTPDEGSPCNAFKREIVREKSSGRSRTLNRMYLFGLAFTAWNKYVKNETVKYLRPPKEVPKLAGYTNPW